MDLLHMFLFKLKWAPTKGVGGWNTGQLSQRKFVLSKRKLNKVNLNEEVLNTIEIEQKSVN